MKTRAQIYSHEASGILRDISTYGVLTQKQIFGLYPQKDEQIKNLLSYLCKQKRLFLVDGFYSLTPELPKDRDRGLEAAVTRPGRLYGACRVPCCGRISREDHLPCRRRGL